ncbi:S8 family serine peptidase [Umezawaea endophytica]|uniref:S8 family serine peptidase n=1 Tax=Umezawaea endophytica TaxID=1654476 RepID=A0A9X2VU88_9PSEU|nr:S8 family serine peptidase [Umezawaea endophytica]MCS7482756.1 S8 family serine peptidase [Umezawaea endophytica]
MRSTRRHGALLGVAALAFGLVVGSAGESTAAESAPTRFPAAGKAGSVTLITGDRVVLDGTGGGSVVKAAGRDNVVFTTSTEQGHVFVVPADARRAVASGRVDRRLFDVTELIESRYDDAHRDSVPLILTTGKDLRAAGSPVGTAVTGALPTVRSFAARTAKAQAASAWSALLADSAYTKIRLDGLRQPTLDRSVAQIGAPAAWQAGYTGTGVKVAVLDTGVDAEHPDLKGRELVEQNFTEDADNQDLVGHGTHVAATIASAGAKYRGVAPDAKIMDGKVCVLNGCAESWILDGMAWAAEQGADVVNLSLGGGDSPEIDPLEEAVNTLSAQYGTLFVIAAGNSGGAETIGSPGSADAALTVGAVDRNDGIAPFSSRGPRVGDGAVKPDVTAPGVGIVAAKSSTGVIGTPAGDGYVSMSGTSMATPHVAGAAALLKQQHPDWTGSRIKAALVASAKPNPALTAFDQGTGRIDLTKAITQTVTAEPASLSLGLHEWPHADDVPVSKEVVYRNSGTDAVALDVAVDVKGPDGKPAPAGLLTASPAKVTVPAGGEAKVVVTGDTRIGSVDGAYTGTVVATTASGAVRSPLSIVREVESYTVTVNHTGPDGKPAPDSSTALVALDTMKAYGFYEEDGSSSVRVPKGDYFGTTYIVTGSDWAVLTRPKLTVSGDTVVDIDARVAKPVKVSVPEPAAEGVLGEYSVTRRSGQKSTGYGLIYLSDFGDTLTTAQLGPDVAPGDLTARMGVQWRGTPDGDTPINYRFGSAWLGKAPTGHVRDLAKKDFAEVRTTVGPTPEGRTHAHALLGTDPDGGGGWSWIAPMGESGTMVDLVAGDNTTWGALYDQVSGNSLETEQVTPPKKYKPGKSYELAPNYAVFSPGLDGYLRALGRSGDSIRASVPLFSDNRGGEGYSLVDSARTTLFRNGTKVGETTTTYGDFTVPAEAGAYRLESEATRSGVSEFSTRVSAAWTFRSAHVDGQQSKSLPLSVVRFLPKLDKKNSAPAGRLIAVPLLVQQNPGADNGRVNRITVDVSFDDGKTWRHAPVIGRSAIVHNGPAGSFASLRAKATDSKGNSVENTVIRAYKIAG